MSSIGASSHLSGQEKLPCPDKADRPAEERAEAKRAKQGPQPMPDRFALMTPQGPATVNIQKLIGQGSFGQVYAVSIQKDGDPAIRHLALKVAKVDEDSSRNARVNAVIEREIGILRKWTQINPDNTIPLARLIVGPLNMNSDRICFLQELYNCNLYDLISHHPTGLPLPHVKIFTAQMVPGLEALSQAGMTHSDIKPENILYHQRRNRFCITDADCCAEGGEQANERKLCVGTLYYRAPEIAYGLPYGPQADIWSFGCTLFEVLTGQVLLLATGPSNLQTMFTSLLGPAPTEFIIQADASSPASGSVDEPRDAFFEKQIESRLSKSDEHTLVDLANFKNLLNNLLRWERRERLTPIQIKEHPSLARIDWQTLSLSE
ncbi:MAG: protein kinase [Chlamydiae bacterium]|nr:protein kinase [Chlamydiota bacterium]